MKAAWMALLNLACASIQAGEPSAMGIIDIQKVFEGYSVAQEANQWIQTEVEAVRNEIARRTEVRTMLIAEAKKTEIEIQAAKRQTNEEALKELQDKLLRSLASVRDIEGDISRLREGPELTQKIKAQQDKIGAAIRAQVSKTSARKKLLMVLDCSALPPAGLPLVYGPSSGTVDVTDEVIAELNEESGPLRGPTDRSMPSH